jgi:hypothetical protein
MVAVIKEEIYELGEDEQVEPAVYLAKQINNNGWEAMHVSEVRYNIINGKRNVTIRYISKD